MRIPLVQTQVRLLNASRTQLVHRCLPITYHATPSLACFSSSAVSRYENFSSPYRSILNCPLPQTSVNQYRRTSQGPPPAVPKEGSLTAKYEKFISRWPRFYAIHRMVVDGSRWCFSDVKTYIRLKKELNTGKRSFESLTLPELEVLVQSGGELVKMCFLLVVLQIPGPGDILILLLIFFPRLVLTRHFWSDAQKEQFFLADVLKSRADGNALKRELGDQAVSLEKLKTHPVSEFTQSQLFALASLHGMFPLPGVTSRLDKRARAMKRIDDVIDVDSLTKRQLYFHMFIRRIDFSEMSADEMRDTLRKWIKYTRPLAPSSYLCAPVFFDQKKSL